MENMSNSSRFVRLSHLLCTYQPRRNILVPAVSVFLIYLKVIEIGDRHLDEKFEERLKNKHSDLVNDIIPKCSVSFTSPEQQKIAKSLQFPNTKNMRATAQLLFSLSKLKIVNLF